MRPGRPSAVPPPPADLCRGLLGRWHFGCGVAEAGSRGDRVGHQAGARLGSHPAQWCSLAARVGPERGRVGASLRSPMRDLDAGARSRTTSQTRQARMALKTSLRQGALGTGCRHPSARPGGHRVGEPARVDDLVSDAGCKAHGGALYGREPCHLPPVVAAAVHPCSKMASCFP